MLPGTLGASELSVQLVLTSILLLQPEIELRWQGHTEGGVRPGSNPSLWIRHVFSTALRGLG